MLIRKFFQSIGPFILYVKKKNRNILWLNFINPKGILKGVLLD
jgi:hypothetical protein